jgi:hypothetical protein
VAVIGLRLRAHTRERADTQWSDVLGGERVSSDDNALVYRWPRSPMRITVDIDPIAAEGPIAIEFAADRDVEVPPGREPILGAVFTRVPRPRD